MAVAIITGSSGLIGSEACRHFSKMGLDIVGIDNNMRSYFFGNDASTEWNTQKLKKEIPNFTSLSCDIRNGPEIEAVFKKYSKDIALIVHCAAQPSHDWAAKEALTDFGINCLGTVQLLEFTRIHAPDAVFIFTSTNKVYGDLPNSLPLEELSTRWEISKKHPYCEFGIDESFSIDQSKHSLFGASKVGADIYCQEYGRYFGLKTATFRGGCLTGPAHSGAELHGFLAYLVKCQLSGKNYTVFGHKGKQVRDNIHSQDLVCAFEAFFKNPRPGEVYNIGGARHSNCSIIEAVKIVEELSGKTLNYKVSDEARQGDHIWWISDVRKFQNHYPSWSLKYDIRSILKEIVDETGERLKAGALS